MSGEVGRGILGRGNLIAKALGAETRVAGGRWARQKGYVRSLTRVTRGCGGPAGTWLYRESWGGALGFKRGVR